MLEQNTLKAGFMRFEPIQLTVVKWIESDFLNPETAYLCVCVCVGGTRIRAVKLPTKILEVSPHPARLLLLLLLFLDACAKAKKSLVE